VLKVINHWTLWRKPEMKQKKLVDAATESEAKNGSTNKDACPSQYHLEIVIPSIVSTF
jgi:hypothetical protein